jgi:hypothetical protein
MLESRRHFLDAAAMTDAEAVAFADSLRLLTRVIKDVVDAQRIYTWASMVGQPHMHVWLLPWSPGLPEGPSLVSGAESLACGAAEAVATAGRLRSAIHATVRTPMAGAVMAGSRVGERTRSGPAD